MPPFLFGSKAGTPILQHNRYGCQAPFCMLVQSMRRERYGIPINQFRLGSVVQTTEFSVLYESIDTVGGGTAVIEIASRIRFDSPEEIRSYYTRAKKLGSLEHPNIHLPDTFSVTEGNNPFFVWTSLPQHNLWTLLKRAGPLSEQTLREVFSLVCDALICAAKADVWREAIYPSQLLFDQDFRTVALAGFEADLIHSLEDSISPLYKGSSISHLYKAPETGLRKPDFDRSHVYLIGCLMYEARTTRPLELPDYYLLYEKQRTHEEVIEWLYQLPENERSKSTNPEEKIDRIIGKCIELNPLRRYSNVSEVLFELQSP